MRSAWLIGSVALLALACSASDAADGAPAAEAPGAEPGHADPETPTTQGSTQHDDASSPSDPHTGDAGADAADGSVHVPPGSCGTPNPAKGFIASLSVKVGAVMRTYALTVPAGYDGTTLYPLVVGFHGDGGNGAGYRSSFPIEAAGGTSAIFAWPNGTNANNGHSFDQAHDPPANADVAFFDALVAAVHATYCVNTARVYVHGMSGGGYFTNQLGRWRATAIRAIAPQSAGGPFGIQASDYDPTSGGLTINGAVPAFIVHGQADTTVPISEGMKSLTYWRSADHSASGQAASPPSPCQKQNGGTKPILFCAIPGLTHAIWAGAPAAIWQFFATN
jgi:polyhydroxybutyrate depolymerase